MAHSVAAARGAKGTIEWALDSRERSPAREFYERELSEDERAQVMANFQRFADHWASNNPKRFKQIEGTKLSEFKNYQIRFIGAYRPGYRFLVAHGLRKKQDKLARSDMDTAERILQENDQVEKRR